MDGDTVAGEYPLMSGEKIEDWILDDRFLKGYPEVQETIRQCRAILAERKK